MKQITLFLILFTSWNILSFSLSAQSKSVQIDNCDYVSGWSGQSPTSIDAEDMKEGAGCLRSENDGKGVADFIKAFDKTFSRATDTLQFWYYVSDVSKFEAQNQVEFGSGGKNDVNELNWNLTGLQNGWNLVQLPFSKAGVSGGTPDLNAMNYMRIYRFKSGSVTTKIDDIRLLGHSVEDIPEDTTGSSPNVLPNNEAIAYQGRIDFSNPLKPRFSYSGISISTHFEGTSISVSLKPNRNDKSFYYVFIDDQKPFKINPNTSGEIIELASGMEDTLHTLRLVKLTETLHSIDVFNGFVIDKDKNVYLPESNAPLKFEFIGNSITCGFGNESLDKAEGNNPAKQNFYESYAGILTRAFRAEQIAISVSGIGMYRNNGGAIAGSENCLPATYDRIIYKEITPKWAYSRYSPDVVFVNLGTNDLGGSGEGYDLTLFENAYRNFIETLRTNYPNAKLVLTIGAMLGGNGLSDAKTTIEKMVSERHAAGDTAVFSFIMSKQLFDLGYGAAGHPTVAQNYKNSGELLELIENITNTNSSPIISKVDFGELQNEIEITVTKPMLISDDLHGFSVTLNGNDATVDSAYVRAGNSSVIVVRLSENPIKSDEVRLFYHSGNAYDENGFELISFTMYNTNFSERETKISSLEISEEGTDLTVLFNKPMLAVEDIEGITISDAYTNAVPMETYSMDEDGKRLIIKFSDYVSPGSILYLSYNGDKIKGQDKLLLNSVERMLITNHSIVGIFDYEMEKETIQVYPNPAQDVIIVDTGELFNKADIGTIKIINNIGTVVFESLIKGSIMKFSTFDIGRGGYYVVQVFNKYDHVIGVTKVVLE